MRIDTREQNREIEELMREFVSRTVDFYEHIENEAVCRPAAADSLARIEEQAIPAGGRPVEEVFREMERDIYSSTLLGQHPRSFSCVPSTMTLLSWMGDVMTSAYNPHASCKINAPAADAVEKKLIRWMCEKAGYPEGSGGLFVSGGSIANLTALTAARDAKLAWEDRGRAVVYLSGQTHASVSKGLHMIGFCREQLRILPVDGAFGASALLSEKHRGELAGIELSDSLSWDAHKWMLQTYGCSAVLVRRRSDLVRSFAAHPEYLKDAETSEGGVEFWDLGPELTRPARGLKLWLTLQTMGTEEMGRVVDHGCELAELAAGLIRNAPEWELLSGPWLGIVNFRYRADGSLTEAELDETNQEISVEMTGSGFAQVFTTELTGKKVLRMCIVNPETTEEDVRRTIGKMMKAEAVLERDRARKKSRTA